MFFSEVTKIVSAEQVARVSVDEDMWGNLGKYVVYPSTEQEISALLSFAHANMLRIIPEGGGSKRSWGGSVKQADLVLSLSRLRGIVEHSAGDMTISVHAGTPMKQINDYLEEYGQTLPLDPCWPEYATIGGVVCANDSGPKRCRLGSARDFVIGLRVVLADGQVVRTGGKVVKNVAGYDMNKLYIGSMGTLGVISQLTLKLRPLPAYESLVLLSFPDHQLQALRSFAVELLDSPLEPITLELLNPVLVNRLLGTGGYALAVGFADVEKAVHYQEEWIAKRLPSNTRMEIIGPSEAKKWWASFAQLTPAIIPDQPEASRRVGVKLGSKNMDVIELISIGDQLAVTFDVEVEAHGGIGHGISKLYLDADDSKLLPFIRELRQVAIQKGGYAVLQHAPSSIREQLEAWGEQPVYQSILVGIKQKLDPRNTLNYQRYVGGI